MDENIAEIMKLGNDLESFMGNYVDSFIKWEVLQFFHQHPRATYKLEVLAEALGRPAKTLKRELQELVDKRLLHEDKGKPKGTAYLYDLSENDPAERSLAQAMDHFVKFCQTREGRLRVIYKVLKDGKPIGGR